MNIAKQDIALAKQVAEAKMKALGVKVDPAVLEDYKLALRNIDKNHHYAEGERLSFEDEEPLAHAMFKMVKGIGNAFSTRPDHVKRKANVAGMLMAANDYMIAIAMEELNSPIIYDDFTNQLKTVYSAAAGRMVESKPRKDYYPITTLKEQRGINAQELKNSKVDKLIKEVNDNPNDMEKVADLYAEYQALATRQENHGAIWRFFHRKENEARAALLNEMRSAMVGKVSESDLDSRLKFPESLIREAEEAKVQEAIDEELTNRQMNPEKGFEYFKYKNNPDLPLPGTDFTIKDFLDVKYRPNMERVAEEMAIIKPYTTALNQKQIWSKDTDEHKAISELFSRNYLRLRMAEQKLEGHNGNVELAEKEIAKMNQYYQMQDNDFANQHPDFKLTDIPDLSEASKSTSAEKKDMIDLDQLKKDTSEAPAQIEDKRIEQPVVSISEKGLN